MLAVGAHPDDIEIGCGGTILKLIEEAAVSELRWVVLSGKGERAQEARRSAEALLAEVPGATGPLQFPTASFPMRATGEGLLRAAEGRILARRRLHPSARRPAPGPPEPCELTWNTFRDHLILEYEVPKYDGDMSAPNAFVPLAEGLSGARSTT